MKITVQTVIVLIYIFFFSFFFLIVKAGLLNMSFAFLFIKKILSK